MIKIKKLPIKFISHSIKWHQTSSSNPNRPSIPTDSLWPPPLLKFTNSPTKFLSTLIPRNSFSNSRKTKTSESKLKWIPSFNQGTTFSNQVSTHKNFVSSRSKRQTKAHWTTFKRKKESQSSESTILYQNHWTKNTHNLYFYRLNQRTFTDIGISGNMKKTHYNLKYKPDPIIVGEPTSKVNELKI